MNHFLRMAAGAAALALAGSPAAAGMYTDALSRCLVEKTGAPDRTLLTQWVFIAMSLHPSVKDIGHSSEAKRKELSGKAARLFERLMTVDCRSQTVAAVRYEGVGAIQSGFGVLGEVAMTDLMAHPEVNRELDAMAAQIDTKRMEAMMGETAAPSPPK